NNHDLTNTTVVAEAPPRLMSRGNALPAPVRLGEGGVELRGPVPALLETFERLEGMRVTLDDALAAGPINRYGDLYVSPDGGAGLERRTRNGGAHGTARAQVHDLVRLRLRPEQQ